MKLEGRFCPNCKRVTLQARINIPQWSHGSGRVADFKKKVWYCIKCHTGYATKVEPIDLASYSFDS